MKYEVYFKVTSHARIEVYADDKNDAYDIAYGVVSSRLSRVPNSQWDIKDYEVTEIEKEKEK
jgi:hypothetical protein